MDAYRTLGWYYPGSSSGGRGIITVIFKKTHPIVGEIDPVYPVEYVTKYKEGLERVSAGDFKGSIPLYEAAMAEISREVFRCMKRRWLFHPILITSIWICSGRSA